MVCSRYPKECRFYDTTLKRKCFQTLKINVWENKVKWKLVKKADVHYKIKTLSKYFKLWSEYCYSCLKQKNNYNRAKAHRETKLKSKGIAAFKRNVHSSLIFNRLCHHKIEWNMKYRAWHQWKHYTEKRSKIREIKTLGNKIKQERVVLKFLYIWSFRFKERQALKGAYQRAAAKHSRKLLEKFFKSWKIFKEKKVCKKQIEKLSVVCYEDKLKERVFTAWVRYQSHKTRYKSQGSLIRTFYENYILKKHITQWCIAHKQLNDKCELYNTNLADMFYRRKLLEKSLKSLLICTTSSKQLKRKQLKFREIYSCIYFNYYLNVWVERKAEKLVWDKLESKAIKWREFYLIEVILTEMNDKYRERKEEKQQIVNVNQYFNSIIKHKAFEKWLEFTLRRINKQLQVENALEFYLEKLQHKALARWKKFLIRKRQKNMAGMHYENVIVTKAFDTWKNFLKERKAKMSEVVKFERKNRHKLMKNAFGLWKAETNCTKSNLEAAAQFYCKSKVSRSFGHWKNYTKRQIFRKNRFNRNKNILNCVIIKNALSQWYEELRVKRTLNRKLEEVWEKQNGRVVGFYFKTWRKFVKKRKELKQRVDNFPNAKSDVILDHYFRRMVESLGFSRVLRRKEELAIRTEDKILKRRYLRKWMAFVCWKKLQVLSCVSEKNDVEEVKREVENPVCGISTRRQPIIPEYLKTEFSFDDVEEETTGLNNETFRVSNPVNKKLPIVGQKGTYLSFEV